MLVNLMYSRLGRILPKLACRVICGTHNGVTYSCDVCRNHRYSWKGEA